MFKIDIIAEIGSNWEGNIVKGQKIINECKNAGADAVKFQMWRADDLYRDHPEFKIIKRSELNFSKAEKLKKFADKIGIEFFCSVFYPEAVDFLESLNVKKYKIASRTCLFKDPFSLETLNKVAKTKKPVILSMGMGGNKEKINKIFTTNQLTHCYCISEYPTKFEKINWKKAVMYDGFSDHTLGITAGIVYAVLKNQMKTKQIIIEKHVKLKNSKGPDASSSITTDDLSDLVSHVRLIEKTSL